MENIIKITTNEQGLNVVSARELHAFLEVQTQFTKWCERMFEYGFEENKDYLEVLVKNDYNSNGGRPSIDYAFLLDIRNMFETLGYDGTELYHPDFQQIVDERKYTFN